MIYREFDTTTMPDFSIVTAPNSRYLRPSSSYAAPLEMRIHLTNGSTARFVQPDHECAECLLADLQPQRLFRKPQIVLESDGSLTTIPSTAVEHIALLNVTMPAEWALNPEIEDVVEFSPDSLTAESEASDRVMPDLFIEFEMRSGQISYLRVSTGDPQEIRLPLDAGLAFSHLLERPVVLGRRAEGGIFLLNPANVVRFTVHSNPITALSGVYKTGGLGPKMATSALPAGHYYS